MEVAVEDMEVAVEEKEASEVLEADMVVKAEKAVVDMEAAAAVVDMVAETVKVDLEEFQAMEEMTGLGD